jgi:hypothetical protein
MSTSVSGRHTLQEADRHTGCSGAGETDRQGAEAPIGAYRSPFPSARASWFFHLLGSALLFGRSAA